MKKQLSELNSSLCQIAACSAASVMAFVSEHQVGAPAATSVLLPHSPGGISDVRLALTPLGANRRI